MNAAVTPTVTITADFISAGGTAGCGFTDAQIAILDGPGKPRKGWRSRAIGKQLSYERAHAFLFAARRPKRRPKPGSLEEAAALALLDGCASHGRAHWQRAAAMTSTAQVRRSAPEERLPLIPVTPTHRYDDAPPWE